MSRLPPPFGPFHPVRRLGAGGMAETFVAVRRGPGGFSQNVCIKRILPAFESDAEFVESFLQEARMSAALRHANIVQVLDFGVADESHYLALELIDGLDLRALLGNDSEQRMMLDPDCVALIAADVSAALEHAHSDAPGRPSVVHRDVSPSNVLISVAGEVKLTDFGIARATSGRGRTATGIIKGKVPYMPPEYIERSSFDPRGDLFSLGVMLYETLAGQRPFDGHSDIDTVRRIVAGHHTHLGALVQGAPAHLIQCIERLLTVRPDDRYPSARALLEALPPIATHRVRRRLGDLVRQRMQEIELGRETPEPPATARHAHEPQPLNDLAYSTTASARVPDSRIDRLPRTHTREPIQLSEPSTDTRPRQRGPSSRALWTLAASGVVSAVVAALVLLRPADLGTSANGTSASPAPPSAAPPANAATPQPSSPQGTTGWERDEPIPSAPSAPQPLNNGAGDPSESDRVVVLPEPGTALPTGELEPETFPNAAPVRHTRSRPTSKTSNGVSAARPTRPEPSTHDQQAELKIFVAPFGDVWVDGKRLGQAPVSIHVDPGVHEVAVGDGRPKERRSITVEAGQQERLEITRRDLGEAND